MEKLGVTFPDYLIHEERDGPGPLKEKWLRIVRSLKPGVTELYIHAGQRTEEMKSITGTWNERAGEKDLFTEDADMRALLKELNIIRIGYRPLRDLMRKGAKAN